MPKVSTGPVDKALAKYRSKRRFTETTEPDGHNSANTSGKLYLIQKHDATRLHYDFRLELDGVLLSWAVTRGPSYSTKDKRLAVRTEDHPLEYGKFEGTIPKGNYGGGTVMLWDRGIWEPVGDVRQGLKDGKFAFLLHGERLQGRWALVRMRPDAKALKSGRENWLLIKEVDDLANTSPDLLEDSTSSVVTGRSLSQIAQAAKKTKTSGKLPAFSAPMLATLVNEPPAGKDWIYEIKYDGYRALIAADGGDVKIFTRSGLDWTVRFKQIAETVIKLNLDGVLIDTEIVVIDSKGRTDFGALVSALETGKGLLSCFAFDLLAASGKDQRGETLLARKKLLQNLLGKSSKDAVIHYSEDFSGNSDTGASLLKSACTHNLEGIIAKRANSLYRNGRHGDWLKIKCGHSQEFVIIGFSASSRNRPFASILLAMNGQAGLRYAGRVGSGFGDAALAHLASLRDQYKVKASPCRNVPASMARGTVWVKPVLIAQIEFAGWTRDNMIRHGNFTGLREDKAADEVVMEQSKPGAVAPNSAGLKAVAISHAERVIYPDEGISKGDVAAYFKLAAPLMMPYLTNRFVSFLRCPGGITGKCFFQRHPSAGFGSQWIGREFVNKSSESETYIYCKTQTALMSAVQMGVLEFHIWGSKIDSIEKPDRIVFDLDPDEAVSFETVKDGAYRLRDVLTALELESLPLLSGGKGIHIVVPLQRHHEWPVVKAFAANLAMRVTADDPKRFVATMSKAKRKGKIFIDHFRNERGATAIAPYAPRARAGAPIAWPVSWAGLRDITSANAMSLKQASISITAGENNWSNYGRIKQLLTSAALKALNVE